MMRWLMLGALGACNGDKTTGPTGDTATTTTTTDTQTVSTVGQRIDTVLTLTGDASAGEGLYLSNCAACHGADGSGIANGAADLTEVLPQITREEVVTTILEGRGNMDAYDRTLDNQQVADVVAYIEAQFAPTDTAR
jgi:mono/diheme cytochrome c family protein